MVVKYFDLLDDGNSSICDFVFYLQIHVSEIYKLFCSFGEIHNVVESKGLPEEIHIDFATIADDRINRACDKITLNEHEFSFRFGGFRNYPDVGDYGDILQREKQEIAMNQNEVLEMAPDRDAPGHISFCDYCLLEIFDQLNLYDLCEAANVCKWFNSIAIHVVEVKYKYNHIEAISRTHKIRKRAPLSLYRAGLYLETFEVSKFDICMHYVHELNRKILLAMCANNCSKMKSLQINATAFDDDASYMRCLMPELKVLHITDENAEMTWETIKRIEIFFCHGMAIDDCVGSVET